MKTILLLHGAIGSSQQLEPLRAQLEKDYQVHCLNFPGYGGTAVTEPFSISLFAKTVQDYCEQKKLTEVNLFGYSMGGYVALYLAREQPQLLAKVVTLATKWEWNEAIAAKEIKMLDPEVIEQKLPSFAAALQRRHAPQDWKQVLNKTAAMLVEMGKQNPLTASDFSTIVSPIRLLLGDRDKMVTLEETIAIYKQLPHAELGILPNTSHPIEQVNIDLLAFHIKQFIG